VQGKGQRPVGEAALAIGGWQRCLDVATLPTRAGERATIAREDIMSTHWMRTIALVCAALLAACGSSAGGAAGSGPGNDTTGGTIADSAGQDASSADSGVAVDAGTTPDSAAAKDVGAADADGPVDAGAADAGAVVDAGGPVDAGTALDAGGPVDAGGPDPTQWTNCEINKDCVAVEVGCCDHCNGGKLMSFNKKFADVAKAKHQEKPCKNKACTEKGCAAPVALCDKGTCAWKADPAFPWGCAKLGEVDCNVSPKCTPLWAWAPAGICKNKPGPKAFKGCMNSGMGCGDAETCARHAETAELMVFPSTCLPEGWKSQPYETCCTKGSETCAQGAAATLGKICVRGPGGSTDIKAGQPVQITVYPKGCMSSSCTKIHSSGCAVSGSGGGLDVTGLICLEGTGGGICTADCNGGGFAKCDSGNVSAGKWVAKMAGLSVSFTVPSTVPVSGVCAGAQW